MPRAFIPSIHPYEIPRDKEPLSSTIKNDWSFFYNMALILGCGPKTGIVDVQSKSKEGDPSTVYPAYPPRATALHIRRNKPNWLRRLMQEKPRWINEATAPNLWGSRELERAWGNNWAGRKRDKNSDILEIQAVASH